MKFFFPDSQDQVDPSFDFVTEERSTLPRTPTRRPVRARGIRTAAVRRNPRLQDHRRRPTRRPRQVHRRAAPPALPRRDPSSSSDSIGHRGRGSDDGRLRRVHLRPRGASRHTSPDEVIDFYDGCGFDSAFLSTTSSSATDPAGGSTRSRVIRWQRHGGRGKQLTLELAADVLRRHAGLALCPFTPIGVAQGWSPKSYAKAVQRCSGSATPRIALGGMVPLRRTRSSRA